LPAAIVHALPLAQGPLRGLGDEVLSGVEVPVETTVGFAESGGPVPYTA
jgi:hypothetical protein